METSLSLWGVVWSFSMLPVFPVLGFVFFHRRNKEPIRSRGWQIQLFSSLICWIWMLTRAPLFYLETDEGNKNSCLTFHFLELVTVPFIGSTFFVRAYMLWFKWKFSNLLRSSHFKESSFFIRYRMTVSPKGLWKLLGIFDGFVLLYSVVICLAVDKSVHYGYWFDPTCKDVVFFGIRMLHACSVFLGAVIFFFLLWNEKDVFGFKSELKVVFSLLFLNIALTLLNFVGIWDFVFLTPYNNQIHVMFSTSVGVLILLYPIVLSYQPYYKMISRNVLKDTDLNNEKCHPLDSKLPTLPSFAHFLATLRTPLLRDEFTVFLTTNWCVENLLLYDELDCLSRSLIPVTLQQCQQIYNTYLSPNSMFYVNVDDAMLQSFQERMDSGAKEFDADILDEITQDILVQLYRDSFFKWFKTERFQTLWSGYNFDERAKSNDDSVDLTVFQSQSREY
eukprot:Lithocolla_globosa_v1_NODE_223_length_5052_cov_23.804283.p1 type:complete len:448 gc:universal NODE_223_length_5052_cov_23.804283:2893-4236(+)